MYCGANFDPCGFPLAEEAELVGVAGGVEDADALPLLEEPELDGVEGDLDANCGPNWDGANLEPCALPDLDALDAELVLALLADLPALAPPPLAPAPAPPRAAPLPPVLEEDLDTNCGPN